MGLLRIQGSKIDCALSELQGVRLSRGARSIERSRELMILDTRSSSPTRETTIQQAITMMTVHPWYSFDSHEWSED